LTQPGNGVAYSIQAPGPHGPGYRLAGSPVSCRQLEADASRVGSYVYFCQWCGASRHCLASRQPPGTIFTAWVLASNLGALVSRNMPQSCWCLEALNFKSCVLRSHPLNWDNKLLKSECNLCYEVPLCQYCYLWTLVLNFWCITLVVFNSHLHKLSHIGRYRKIP